MIHSDCGQLAVLPAWLIRHPDLSDAAVRLYGVLSLHSGSGPTRVDLGAALQISVDSIDRSLRALVSARAIKITKSDGRSNRYSLCYATPPESGEARPSPEGTPPSQWENTQLTTRTVAAVASSSRYIHPRGDKNNTVQTLAPLKLPKFMSIWDRYPHRQYRDRATQRWIALGAEEDVALFAEIDRGLTRWLAYWEAELTPRRYIPYLHNWLGNQRWVDWPVVEPRLSKQSRGLAIASKDLLQEEDV
jgi:hypothetical protein